MKFTRSTAILACVALLASALIGFAIGRVHSSTTAHFKNTASSLPPVLSGLGFYPGYASVAQLQSMDTWLGRNAQYIVQFADGDKNNFAGSVWGQVVNAGALQTIAGQIKLVESIPLAFGGFVDTSTAQGQAAARTALQATVDGSNDAEFIVAANYLRNGGYGDAIIRLGWEFDGGWMPWSSRGNEALWAGAFRHVVGVFRSVSPNFRFDWNGDPSYLQTETAAYPGDAYVDMIGLDVYDKGIPVAWNSSTKSWSDPNAAWNWELGNLRWQRDFAIAHSKQVSYPEWGLSGVNASTTSNVGGDDSTFVKGMYDWMTSLPASGGGSLAYHSYFNEDADDGNHRLTTNFFPNAQALYRTLFGSSADVTPPPPPPVTTVPATTVPATTTPTTTVTTPTTQPATVTTRPVTTVPGTTVPVTSVPTQVVNQAIASGKSARNIGTESTWPGARSTPYACCWAAQGQYVTFAFTAAGGPTALAVRYSAGNGAATRKLELDGAVIVAGEVFPATASWSTWSSVYVNATLTRGAHTLKVWFDEGAGSAQFVNLDTLTVTQPLVLPAATAARNITVESTWPGARSISYACCWASQGQYVTFAFNALGGSTVLSLRYSAGNGVATRKIDVDAVPVVNGQAFKATASWNAWSSIALNKKLTKGKHTVTVWFDAKQGSANFLNLDYLAVKTG